MSKKASIYIFFFAVIGNCLFAYGRKLGELCRRDADCESGLVCDVSPNSGGSVCRAPMAIAKQYAEECSTSIDCDVTRYYLNLFLLEIKKNNLSFIFIYFSQQGPLLSIAT